MKHYTKKELEEREQLEYKLNSYNKLKLEENDGEIIYPYLIKESTQAVKEVYIDLIESLKDLDFLSDLDTITISQLSLLLVHLKTVEDELKVEGITVRNNGQMFASGLMRDSLKIHETIQKLLGKLGMTPQSRKELNNVINNLEIDTEEEDFVLNTTSILANLNLRN